MAVTTLFATYATSYTDWGAYGATALEVLRDGGTGVWCSTLNTIIGTKVGGTLNTALLPATMTSITLEVKANVWRTAVYAGRYRWFVELGGLTTYSTLTVPDGDSARVKASGSLARPGGGSWTRTDLTTAGMVRSLPSRYLVPQPSGPRRRAAPPRHEVLNSVATIPNLPTPRTSAVRSSQPQLAVTMRRTSALTNTFAGAVPLMVAASWLAACGGGSPSGPAASLVITGTVTGLEGSGLVLQNNGASDLEVPGGSPGFVFTDIREGSSYRVTIKSQPATPTQACTISNGSGVARDAVYNLAVACTTTPFVVRGSITGLTGTAAGMQGPSASEDPSAWLAGPPPGP